MRNSAGGFKREWNGNRLYVDSPALRAPPNPPAPFEGGRGTPTGRGAKRRQQKRRHLTVTPFSFLDCLRQEICQKSISKSLQNLLLRLLTDFQTIFDRFLRVAYPIFEGFLREAYPITIIPLCVSWPRGRRRRGLPGLRYPCRWDLHCRLGWSTRRGWEA